MHRYYDYADLCLKSRIVILVYFLWLSNFGTFFWKWIKIRRMTGRHLVYRNSRQIDLTLRNTSTKYTSD